MICERHDQNAAILLSGTTDYSRAGRDIVHISYALRNSIFWCVIVVPKCNLIRMLPIQFSITSVSEHLPLKNDSMLMFPFFPQSGILSKIGVNRKLHLQLKTSKLCSFANRVKSPAVVAYQYPRHFPPCQNQTSACGVEEW
jgi:hypothetical protein